MHERNLLVWNIMFAQICSKWRNIFREGIINFAWKNYLGQLAVGNFWEAISWRVIIEGVIVRWTIIDAPIPRGPIFLGAIVRGQFSRGGGAIVQGAITLGDNCLGGNCPGAIFQSEIVLEPKFYLYLCDSSKYSFTNEIFLYKLHFSL